MGLTKCKTVCFGNKDCQKRKKRACECGKYAATSLSIEDACIKEYANAGKFDNMEEWEFSNAEAIFIKTGVIIPGYDPNDNFLLEQQTKVQYQESESASTNRIVLIGVLFMLMALLGYALIPNKNGAKYR